MKAENVDGTLLEYVTALYEAREIHLDVQKYTVKSHLAVLDAQKYLDRHPSVNRMLENFLKEKYIELRLPSSVAQNTLLMTAHQILKNYLNPASRCTSPGRKKIRMEAYENTASATVMTMQHDKSRSVQVYKISDFVSIKIPHEDRRKADPRRLPAMVTKVSGGNFKSFVLFCPYMEKASM